ncbi:unnamed protein product [Tilletia controversa]|nr:unnamed protein product [Tilletia controversa]
MQAPSRVGRDSPPCRKGFGLAAAAAAGFEPEDLPLAAEDDEAAAEELDEAVEDLSDASISCIASRVVNRAEMIEDSLMNEGHVES